MSYYSGRWTVAVRFAQLAGDRLPGDIVASLAEAFGVWVIGSIAGIIVGTAVGRSRTVALILKPLLNFLRHLSPLAWVPLAILWFGVGYWSKTSVIVLIAFFSLVLNTAHGVRWTRPFCIPDCAVASVSLDGQQPDGRGCEGGGMRSILASERMQPILYGLGGLVGALILW